MSSAAKRAAVAGELHKIVKRYGVVDGKNRKIYKSYAVIGGINRLIYMSENFAFTGAYAVSLVEIDGTTYDLYKLTTSGMLSIYADNALFWMCGGGAGGESSKTGLSAGHRSGNAGGGGAGAFCVSGDLPTGKYPVEIGAGGAADNDGLATTLGEYAAAGGKTGKGGTGGIGGTGGGGAASGDYSEAWNGQGGAGDQVDKYPFGLSSMGAHCAGGGGGMLNYSDSYMYITGGKGGTNGGHGNSSNSNTSTAGNGTGGEKGGGNGGDFVSDGKGATFYGSAGGGAGVSLTGQANTYKGGSGYQGVVYIAIPHKQEPLIIIRQPEDVTAVVNGNASFSVAATGEGLTYQWQALTNGATEWVDTSANGNKTSTVTMTTEIFKNGYRYRCIITDKYGNQKISDAATLTVVPILITKQPEDVTASVGDTATFTVEASGTGLAYQWQKQDSINHPWADSYAAGSTTEEITFTVTSHQGGYRYHCVIRDSNDNTVTSDVATLTLTDA